MSHVYITKTSPKTVLSDYAKLMRRANYKKHFDLSRPIVIKINLSWTKFYPACSTPPWQLEAVVKTMLEDGIPAKRIIPVENRTVVTNVQEGSRNNKWLDVLKKYGVKMRYLTDEKYVQYKPKAKLLVMDKVFHRNIRLPKIIIGANMLHVPTMKMHVFTQTTGAIKNYFGMLRTTRHYAHRHIHETIIDLLSIQKEIHPGIFAVMDGTIVGSGSGPRAMQWHIKNLLLAGADQVAIDAVAAKIMGFNPLTIPYLKLGKKLGLGEADIKKIKIVDLKNVLDKKGGLPDFHFQKADTFASRGQKLIYYHSPEWVEKLLLHSFLVPWSYAASNIYHDWYWYNLVGKSRIVKYMKTEWGKLFQKYT